MNCRCGQPWQMLAGGVSCYACDGRPDSAMRSDLDVFTAVPPTWAINRMLRNAQVVDYFPPGDFDVLREFITALGRTPGGAATPPGALPVTQAGELGKFRPSGEQSHTGTMTSATSCRCGRDAASHASGPIGPLCDDQGLSDSAVLLYPTKRHHPGWLPRYHLPSSVDATLAYCDARAELDLERGFGVEDAGRYVCRRCRSAANRGAV